jgi:hypothetical protein
VIIFINSLSFADISINNLSTGQYKTYISYDDGYYKKGQSRDYTRDDDKKIVLDNITNLMWQDDTDSIKIKESFINAKQYCDDLNLANFENWRLPTFMELMSIIDRGENNPALNSIFKNSTFNKYWSNTFYKNDTNLAWVISFDYGKNSFQDINENYNIRCVADKFLSVSENTASGVIGKIDIKKLDSSNLILTGFGSNKFKISKDGNIVLKENQTLDFEDKVSYSLTIKTINNDDTNFSQNLNISIDNIKEDLIINDFNGSIDENTITETIIGTLDIINSGDNPISSITLSGIGNEKFEISNSGIITLKANQVLNYEVKSSYNLVATIDNLLDTTTLNIQININDIIEYTYDDARFGTTTYTQEDSIKWNINKFN